MEKTGTFQCCLSCGHGLVHEAEASRCGYFPQGRGLDEKGRLVPHLRVHRRHVLQKEKL